VETAGCSTAEYISAFIETELLERREDPKRSLKRNPLK